MISASAPVATCTATDGDTLRCGQERVRLAGIDAPEMNGRCAYERRLARRAQTRMAELVAGEIRLEREGRDRYGRTLARVYVGEQDVGAVMVAEGLARVWRGRREPWCR